MLRTLLGFLQKNNSVEDRSRFTASFKERAARSLMLAGDNGGEGARFTRTETDFSNLFARGRDTCSLG